MDCMARTVTEADLHVAVAEAVNVVCSGHETLLPQLKANIMKALVMATVAQWQSWMPIPLAWSRRFLSGAGL